MNSQTGGQRLVHFPHTILGGFIAITVVFFPRVTLVLFMAFYFSSLRNVGEEKQGAENCTRSTRSLMPSQINSPQNFGLKSGGKWGARRLITWCKECKKIFVYGEVGGLQPPGATQLPDGPVS
jgi:hypothetical protein